ncbi:MAG: thioredoxin family protein [Phycisphaerales bacterium]|nr:thioredoxin family protein [Phycisphaerales bacterium]
MASTSRRTFLEFMTFAVATVAVVLFLRFVVIGGVAPTPSLFDEGMTLEQALDAARLDHRPVLVVSTSDSCVPCQVYKRGTLADPEATGVIRDAMIPVYLNVGTHPDDAARLGIAAVPTTQVLVDDTVVASATGALSRGQLLELVAPWTGPTAAPTQAAPDP